jgi:hypothetical protein
MRLPQPQLAAAAAAILATLAAAGVAAANSGAPWSGEYVWPASEDRVFEYACHEGNYALGNIMRGARLLEAEALAKSPGSD